MPPRSPARIARYVLVLTTGWVVMSGRIDTKTLAVGLLTSLLIAWFASPSPDRTPVRIGPLLAYIPWLIGQIVLSNLRVARLVLSPNMPIRPTMIRKPPGVHGGRALAALGISTTLTPGTLTVDVGEGETMVHALDQSSAEDVLNGVIAERVRRVFGQEAP